MDTPLKLAILSAIAIVLAVGITAWNSARSRFYLNSSSLEFLAREARPLKRSLTVLISLTVLTIVIQMVVDGWGPRLEGAAIWFIGPIILLCYGAHRHFKRVQALEAIVNASHPQLYSIIKTSKQAEWLKFSGRAPKGMDAAGYRNESDPFR